MYTRAVPYDKETIFYFDRFGNKYVAKGGSLAWRTNNPGLVHSHALTSGRSIGTCDQIAIFSSPSVGEKTLYNWLKRKKYYHSTLLEIAKHYAPNDPKFYIESLTNLTHLKNDKPISSFSKNEFQTLVQGIKHLAGYSSTGDEEFKLLPKIAAKFFSKEAKVESYLVANQFLNREDAINQVESHLLDAVIVHKNDGSTYLRSRPGHHSHKIHLRHSDTEKEIEFEDIIRTVGTKKPNQCIWAFINGILNSADSANESTSLISKHVGNELVWSLVNDTKIWPIGDIAESIAFKIGIESKIVKMAVNFLKFLINLSNDNPTHPPIVIIAHSQGAMICELATKHLTQQECQKLHIHTFGGWAFIPPDRCHKDTHNYFSPYDLIAKGGSPGTSTLLLRIEDGKKRGITESAVIDEIISEDQDFYLDTRNPSTIQAYRRQRKEHYIQILEQASNVTLINKHIEGPFEHSFGQKCYQNILKNILNNYKEQRI